MNFYSDNYQNLTNPADSIQYQEAEFENNANSFLTWFKQQTTEKPERNQFAKEFADIKSVDIYYLNIKALNVLIFEMIQEFESVLEHDENYNGSYKLNLEDRTIITATIFAPFFIAFIADSAASKIGDEFTEKHTKIIKTVLSI